MVEGGRFTRNTDHAIRYMAFLIAPVFIVQSLLVMLGYLPDSNYTSPSVTVIFVVLWFIVGLYHFFAPLRSKADMLGRFVILTALTLSTLMFVTGFFQPFVIILALIFLAAHIYFGYRGFMLALLSILIGIGLDTVVRAEGAPDILPLNLMATVAILLQAIIILAIISNQDQRHSALAKSQRLERLQYDRILTIINNLTDATLSTDSRGRVQLYNAACLNLLDTNDSLKGKDISDLFTLTDTDGASIALYDLLKDATRTSRRDDVRHTYADGEQIRLEITFSPIKSSFGVTKKHGHDNGFIVIARDVTKEKSLEEERDEFISVVSHELRTPITIVEGSLSNLQFMISQPKGLNERMLTSSIKTAHDQVLYLAKMVNDLSTLSRAERGVADDPEDIDVTDMLHNLHRQYEKEASEKGLQLNLDLGSKLGTIYSSRLYTEELLQNFITNAIKYTKEGSITVTAQRAKDIVTFAVKDTGIGISRGDQAKVFQKFYRSEDYRIRETSGTGLGLYVSAKLAHKLGAHIKLVSRLNHGSTFSFELPGNTK